MRRQIDHAMLEMALVGYNARRDEIIQKMADIERRLGFRAKSAAQTEARSGAPAGAVKPKRKLSAAGRRAIREGVKKRWAAFHAQAGTAPAAKQTRKKPTTLTPAVRARLLANLAKARAAKARKRTA